MMRVANPTVETIIREYMEQKEQSFAYGKRKLDAEKEYNRLLTKYNGESKTYSLDQADRILKAYQEMKLFGEESSHAQERFLEAESKLREIGEILFEASITADISFPPVNGEQPKMKEVTVIYSNGNVQVN